jgi:UDP-N-acetylmuramyl-tripeptide synthetase
LGAYDGDNERLVGYASLTTPGPIEFHAVLADLKDRGVSTVVMEASSHGLDQGRLEGAAFSAAVYTNLTHEHLDYHPTLEAYAAAKMKLSDLLITDGTEIVNADDPVWESLPERGGIKRVMYGRGSDSDVHPVLEKLNADGSECRFSFGGVEHDMMIPLLGEFNVSNALAAAATAWSLGQDPDLIAGRMANVPLIPGRMELLASGDFTVLRDYAHTPDGFQRAIATIKAITPGRLVVLFGVGGDRDREKRPVMGRIASEGADLVVLTEDNPRTEDPDSTIDDIEAGMAGVEHLRIRDRELGIHTAIALLERGDCLLLLGKGHETYQIIGTEKLPFDERAIVNAAIAELT